MFVRKNNVIELNFNGLKFNADALDVGLALSVHNIQIRELDASHEFDDEYVKLASEIIEKFIAAALHPLAEKAIEAVYGAEEPSYFDLLDMRNYIAAEYSTFMQEKRSAAGLK